MAERVLIVNADDFGLSEGINRGIVEAHTQGIVTSTSLMVHAPAARAAAQLARLHPRLSVGIHLDLGEWRFHDGEWIPAYLRVPIDDAQAVAAEAEAQIALFRELTGINPTHLDSHQHVHNAEPVRSVVLRAARLLDVPLRNHCPSIRYCGDFYGQDAQGPALSGSLEPARLAAIIRSLEPGLTELCCHPAAEIDFDSPYSGERIAELHALCDPTVHAAAHGPGTMLRSFRGLSFLGN